MVFLLLVAACSSGASEQVSGKRGGGSERSGSEADAAASELPTIDRSDAQSSTATSRATETAQVAGPQENAITANRRATAAGPLPKPPGGYPPGVTDKEIKVGFNWIDLTKTVAVATAAGLPVGDVNQDLREQVRAVARYINANGGIQGRKVIPVFHEVDIAVYLSSNQGRAQEGQRTCTAFTEDEKVFAFVYFLPMDDELNDCAKKAGVIAFANGFIDKPRFQELADWWYNGPGFLINRLLRANLESDMRHNWGKRGDKVGLLIEDRPFIVRGFHDVVVPELKRRGYQIVREIRYPHYQNSPWGSYVLQMQEAGASHIMWSVSEGGPYAKAFFMRAAENQQYRPRYGGISSWELLDTFASVTPPQQLTGQTAMSAFATDEGGVDTAPDNPNKQLCRKIMKEAGIENGAYGCDHLFLLATGLAGAKEFTLKGWRASIEALGNSYRGLGGVGHTYTFGPLRHDPLNAVRDMKYNPSCTCWKYISGIIDLDF